MSDSHHNMLPRSPVGAVVHINQLSEHIGALYLSEEYSDIVLVVEGEKFPAHKVILAARSEYFRALLFGGMKESKQTEIELKGTILGAFKSLLKYVYTGSLQLSALKEDMILDILGLAHQYGFVELEDSISDYLKAVLNIKNVCMIYDMATLYGLYSLATDCMLYMDGNAADIIQHKSFMTLTPAGLKELISRDSFCALEVEIFKAVSEWTKTNSSSDAKDIITAIRLPLMKMEDLLNIVRPTNLISPDAILDAIKTRTESKDTELEYRGFLMPEENVASPPLNAHVLQGEMRLALLDGDSQNYDMERGFTRHPIDDNNGQGILVKLGRQCIVNHISMLLWDKDLRSYSYYIEMSMDQRDWVRVVDHKKYLCRSWQKLYFHPRVARYIRIVGVFNTANRVFHLVSFECMFTSRPFTIENGLVCPKENVATIVASAYVMEGVSRSRNSLLNGDTRTYDWDTGYTCHQLGSGAVVVQLAQPYMIDCMRLLLWDCDDRAYGFYVEVSIDQQSWDVVCDRSHDSCKSWQFMQFERRPVVFIRITGTHNTANEVFHCVHFECPASIGRATPPIDPSEPSTSQAAAAVSGTQTHDYPDPSPQLPVSVEQPSSTPEVCCT